MFRVSDETYNDNIHCAPTHYNALRAKPTYPPALIENNVHSLRPFPNTWIKTKDEWKYFRDERKFAKRCVFTLEQSNEAGLPPIEGGGIHLRSLDTLGNRHLLSENIKFPDEDYIYQVLGCKRRVGDKRNSLNQAAPGDKSYKAVEYSNDFFGRVNRDWRSQKYALPNRSEENVSSDIIKLLDLDANATARFFSNKHHELDYEMDEESQRQEEIRSVKELDSWRAATPLKMPFKVLDLSEKDLVSKKYRPKVTR